jgi:uncharacterized protein (DUF4415 family)
VIEPHEYEEIPELTDADFARGTFHKGGVPVRPGRPKLEKPKQQITLRLDQDVIEHFRTQGRGWQSLINQALRKAMKRRA